MAKRSKKTGTGAIPKYISRSTLFYQKRENILDILFPEGGRTPLIRRLDGAMSSLAPYGLDFFNYCTCHCSYCNFVEKNHFIRTPKWTDREKVYKLFCPSELDMELETNDFQHQILISPYCDPFACSGRRLDFVRRTMEKFKRREIPIILLTKKEMKSATRIETLAGYGDRIQIGTTVLTRNQELYKQLEGNSSSPMARIASLGILQRKGIKTFLALAPLLSADDALPVIEKSLPYVDWYFIAGYEKPPNSIVSKPKDLRASLGITESLAYSLERVVDRLRFAGKPFLVDERLHQECPDVFLTYEELEKTRYWKFKDRSLEI